MAKTRNEKALADYAERARSLVKSHAAGKLTAEEETELKGAAEHLRNLKSDVETERELYARAIPTPSPFGGESSGGLDLTSAMRDAGWNAKSRPDVIVSADALYGRKADVVTAEANAAPMRESGVYGLGFDGRFLHNAIARENIAYQGVPTQIQYLRQTARTFPTTGDATLALAHTTAKPTTELDVALATADTLVFGTVSSSQPNALLGHSDIRLIIESELTNVLRKDVEKHVIDTMAAATTHTYAQGTDTVVDALYKAGQELVDGGHTPKVIALNSTDAQSIDLAKDADDRYIREPGSPLFGVTRVNSAQIPSGTAYVIDTSVLKLYASGVAIAVDGYTEFSKNRSFIRAEHYGVCAINQPLGINEISLS